MPVTGAVVVYTVVDDEAVAGNMARILVDERLAACVQVSPPVTSTYRWEGRVETAAEWGLHCKTTPDRAAALRTRLRELHPYDLPEILSTPVQADPDYLAWVNENTTLDNPPS